MSSLLFHFVSLVGQFSEEMIPMSSLLFHFVSLVGQFSPQLVSEVILHIIIVPVVFPHVCVFVLSHSLVDGICWELFKLVIFFQEAEVNLSLSFLLTHLAILSSLKLL